MDSKILVDEIMGGSEAAFKTLVDEFYPLVLRTANGFLHNHADSQDLSQEVFIEVHRSIHKFRKDASLSTWIYRICVNKSLNFIRDKKRKQFWSGFERVVGDAAQSEADLISIPEQDEADLEVREGADVLYQAIASLPKNQNVAFTLNKIDEIPYKQIAEIMDVSLASVESLIHRAKKNLQKKLSVYFAKT
jgi:RNA polymerase sigma-70 factor, ECF subfamily